MASKNTTRRRLIIEMCVSIVALAIVILGTLFPANSSNPPPPIVKKPLDTCQQQKPFLDKLTGVGVKLNSADQKNLANKELLMSEYIGISDGRFAFDTQGNDSLPKCQASLALASGNRIKDAESFWSQALKLESNDAEAAIYLENQRILDAHRSYTSLLVGTSLTGDKVTIGRDILQGAYVEQKEYNLLHPDSPQIRLLIANFGSLLNETDLLTVALQIKNALNMQTIKGMIGFPPTTSIQPEVYDNLSTLPVVLPAGSNDPSAEGRNIFHVAAATSLEGQAGAIYAEKKCPYVPDGAIQNSYDCPGQNVVLFMDSSNTYSYVLGNAFQQRLQADNKDKLITQVFSYTVGDARSIENQVNILKGLPSPPDLIYFSGTAADANTLLQFLPEFGKYDHLRVLGGDALYELGGYTDDNFRRLDFTAFAYPDEWRWLNLIKYEPAFFHDYSQDFASGKVGYGYDRADNDVILSYDALLTLVQGCTIASNNWKDAFSPEQLQNALTTITASQAVQGASGRIAFGSDGSPMQKALVVLRVDTSGRIHLQDVIGSLI